MARNRDAVTIALAATDAVDPGPLTYTTVNGGSTFQYIQPFIVSLNGETHVDFYSIDAAGNREQTQTIVVRVDRNCRS